MADYTSEIITGVLIAGVVGGLGILIQNYLTARPRIRALEQKQEDIMEDLRNMDQRVQKQLENVNREIEQGRARMDEGFRSIITEISTLKDTLVTAVIHFKGNNHENKS